MDSRFPPINYTLIESYLRANGYIKPHETFRDFLLQQKMIDPNETADEMFIRVSKTLAEIGIPFYGSAEALRYTQVFYELLAQKKLTLSTPIYTNAGRHLSKPMSACVVPLYDFKKINYRQLQNLLSSYHTKGMGTGFNLDEAEDPVTVLETLNAFAVLEVKDETIERPVGNMAILSIDHPKVFEFAQVKLTSPIKDWKFNLSVNINAEFIRAINESQPYELSTNHLVNPKQFLQSLCEFAVKSGCPGVVFMQKHEDFNKIPHLGHYKSVAPCGEVPLLDGEICQFASLNLTEFLEGNTINYKELQRVIPYAIILLDNALELSLQNLAAANISSISNKIRKVGLGLCGFSDVLMSLGLPYDSDEARKLAADLISFINLESKRASVNLARERGPFPAFTDAETRRELIVGAYLSQSTATVSASWWRHLDQSIQELGIRHASTVILPPTGRSAMLVGVNASIEPPFKLAPDFRTKNNLHKQCLAHQCIDHFDEAWKAIEDKGSLAETKLPQALKNIFLTCLELKPEAHLDIVATFQRFTDEAISKTVNLPKGSSAADVADIYLKAYNQGLKGITVYVDQSQVLQPRALGQLEDKQHPSNPKALGLWKSSFKQMKGLLTTSKGKGMMVEPLRLEKHPHLIKYQLEYLDPAHRDPAKLYEKFEQWKQSNTRHRFFTWVDHEEKLAGEAIMEVDYYQDPSPHELSFDPQGLAYQQGTLYDSSNCGGKEPGFALFVVSPQTHKLFVLPYILSKQHHSSLLAGKAVLTTGMAKFNQGVLEAFSLVSGHYNPGINELVHAFTFLAKAGVDLAKTKLILEHGCFFGHKDRYQQFTQTEVQQCLMKAGQANTPIECIDTHLIFTSLHQKKLMPSH